MPIEGADLEVQLAEAVRNIHGDVYKRQLLIRDRT